MAQRQMKATTQKATVKPPAKPRVMTKSEAAKAAVAGKDLGKPGPGFAMIVAKAKKAGARDPEAVAGAQFQRMRKAGKL